MNASAISPEQRLFVGVIVNAAQEAAGNTFSRNRAAEPSAAQEDARSWFVEGGDDFATVCELAGLEPEEVQARVLAYLGRVQRDPAARATVKRTNMPARERNVSIPDVARRAGVSPTTASNVLHNRANVNPATRARVLAAINELGYSRHVH
jgi:hypothetical protein